MTCGKDVGVHLDRARTYSMSNTFRAGGTLVLDAVDDIDSEGLAFGAVVPSSPVRLRIQSRRKVGDFFLGPWPVQIVSLRFVEALEKGGFSGWTTFPVEVIGPLSEELRDHRGLTVTGRSGPPDRSREECVLLPPPVPHGAAMPHRLGYYRAGTAATSSSPRDHEPLRQRGRPGCGHAGSVDRSGVHPVDRVRLSGVRRLSAETRTSAVSASAMTAFGRISASTGAGRRARGCAGR
jgi:hypothetical protein